MWALSRSFPLQALANGVPASSKPSSPALIETKEPVGGGQAGSSTWEEPEQQEAQVCGVGDRPLRRRGLGPLWLPDALALLQLRSPTPPRLSCGAPGGCAATAGAPFPRDCW